MSMAQLWNTLNFVLNHPLNKHNRVAAVSRFVAWQVAIRMLHARIIWEWVDGAKIIVGRGETGLTGNVYCGLHEFNEMAYLLHVVDEQDCFVDVGANAGSYTIVACAVRRARGICFEPVPSTYGRLLENICINHIDDRVQCFNCGVGQKEDVLGFTSTLDTTNHVLSEGEKREDAIEVPVVILDNALSGTSPSIIKIDTEGFELPVLKGASNILQNAAVHTVIIELNGSGSVYGYAEDEIIAILKEAGFSAYDYAPFERKLTCIDGKERSGGNTIFVRNLEHVQKRLRKNPTIVINGCEL